MIDALQELIPTFIEESKEGLEQMERGLLDMSPGEKDSELIDLVFRSAHSIKGGAGSFGFPEISDFTHEVETLLEKLRSGLKEVTQQDIIILLRSCDMLKAMIANIEKGESIELGDSAEITKELDAIIGGEADKETESAKAANRALSNEDVILTFYPGRHVCKTGNEPSYLISTLEKFGDLEVIFDDSQLPKWDEFNAEEVYLRWEVVIRNASCTDEEVLSVFEWLSDSAEKISVERRIQETSQDGIAEQKSTSGTGVQVKASSIRVDTGKIDSLVDFVGELVIRNSRLMNIIVPDDEFGAEIIEAREEINRNVRLVQDAVIGMRLLPIGLTFSRMHRIVHDVSAKVNKFVDLQVTGESTEVDKNILETLADPLTHIIRNCIDHGIEEPIARAQVGKSEAGTIWLSAHHQGGNIVISIKDDGAGLNREKILKKALEKNLIDSTTLLSDQEIYELVFEPGFSTADTVSDVSGRGVGMDVVRRNIAQLGGNIEVNSTEGEGSEFKIFLPLTLAILDGQLVNVGDHVFVIPLLSMIESIPVDHSLLKCVGGKPQFYHLRGEYLPVLDVAEYFGVGSVSQVDDCILVIVEASNTRVGLLMSSLGRQQQVVIKSLEANYKKIDGISGATILGDGKVALILDAGKLVSDATVEVKNV